MTAALATGREVAELVLEKGLLPADRPEALLQPEVVAGTVTTQAV